MAWVASGAHNPADFVFESTFQSLGYCITDEDQIRGLAKPHNRFHYFISSNPRFVEMHKQAMNDCIRGNIVTRLGGYNFTRRLLPNDPPPGPEVNNHGFNRGGHEVFTSHQDPAVVPIFHTKNLSTCKRIIVFFGERSKEMGTLSGRLINEKSIAFGSCLGWVKYVQDGDPDNEVGIIIANVGESIWCRQVTQAISYDRWLALPRDSANAPPFHWLPHLNEIHRNENPEAHIRCVFEDVIAPLTKVGPISINIVSACMTTHALIRFLEKDWNIWKHNIAGVVGTGSFVFKGPDTFQNDEFYDFWRRRCRVYTIDDSKPPNWISRETEVSCLNLTSGKEVVHTEDVFSYVHPYVIDYFKLLSREPRYDNTQEAPGRFLPTYVEPELNTWGNPAPSQYEPSLTGTTLEDTPRVTPVEEVEEAPSEMGESAMLSIIDERTEDSASIRTMRPSNGRIQHTRSLTSSTITPITEYTGSEIDSEENHQERSGIRGGFQPDARTSRDHAKRHGILGHNSVPDGSTQYENGVSYKASRQGSTASDGSTASGYTSYEDHPHGLATKPSITDRDSSSIRSTASSQKTIPADSSMYKSFTSSQELSKSEDQRGATQNELPDQVKNSQSSSFSDGHKTSAADERSSTPAEPQDPHAPGGKLYFRNPAWQELEEEAANAPRISYLSEGERPPSPWTRDIHTDVPGNLYDNEDEEEGYNEKHQPENPSSEKASDRGASIPSPIPLPLFHPNGNTPTLRSPSGASSTDALTNTVSGERSISSSHRPSPSPATPHNGSGYFSFGDGAPMSPATQASFTTAPGSPYSSTSDPNQSHGASNIFSAPFHPPFAQENKDGNNTLYGLKPGSPAHESMEEMHTAVNNALNYTRKASAGGVGNKQRRGAIAAASGTATPRSEVSQDDSTDEGLITMNKQLKELTLLDKSYKSERIMDYLDDCEEGIKTEVGGSLGIGSAVGTAAGKSSTSVATGTTGGSSNSKGTEKMASSAAGDSFGTDEDGTMDKGKKDGKKAEKEKEKEKGNPAGKLNRMLGSFNGFFTK